MFRACLRNFSSPRKHIISWYTLTLGPFAFCRWPSSHWGLLLWKASSGKGFHRCLWSSFSFHENKVIFHPSIFSRWFQTDTGTSVPVLFSKGDAQGQWPPEESLTCWPAFLLPSQACFLPANLASQPNWEELLWCKTVGLLVPEAEAYPSKAGHPWGGSERAHS